MATEILTDMPSPKPLAKASYVVARTGFTLPRVYDLLRQGKIGGAVRIGRRYLIDTAKFEAWLDKLAVNPDTQPG